MTNEQKAGYFLQGEKPNVTIVRGRNPKPYELVNYTIDLAPSGIWVWGVSGHLLKDCATHLYRLEDWRKVIPQNHKVWSELVEKYGGNSIGWYNEFSIESFRKPYIRAVWALEVLYQENICLVPQSEAGEGIKFIDI